MKSTFLIILFLLSINLFALNLQKVSYEILVPQDQEYQIETHFKKSDFICSPKHKSNKGVQEIEIFEYDQFETMFLIIEDEDTPHLLNVSKSKQPDIFGSLITYYFNNGEYFEIRNFNEYDSYFHATFFEKNKKPQIFLCETHSR